MEAPRVGDRHFGHRPTCKEVDQILKDNLWEFNSNEIGASDVLRMSPRGRRCWATRRPLPSQSGVALRFPRHSKPLP